MIHCHELITIFGGTGLKFRMTPSRRAAISNVKAAIFLLSRIGLIHGSIIK